MAKKPKTEKKKDPPKAEKKPEGKAIAPAPKLVLQVKDEQLAKMAKAFSYIGTLRLREVKCIADRDQAFDARDGIVEKLNSISDEDKTARTEPYLRLCADHREVLEKIRKLDVQVKAIHVSYGQLGDKVVQGEFDFADVDVDDLIEKNKGKKGGDPQMTFGGDPPGVDSSWKQLYQFKPDFFPGKEWAQVGQHFGKLEALATGGVPVDNPFRFAEFVQHQFETLTETTDRAGILPAFPDWFTLGLRSLLAAGLKGELDAEGNEEHATDTESMVRRLTDAADRDPDAWVNLCGGSDSPLNQALNAHAAT